MSTHNLCFKAKIRKIGIPLHIPVLLYKSGVQGCILHTNVSVHVQAGLCRTWSETQIVGFPMRQLYFVIL